MTILLLLYLKCGAKHNGDRARRVEVVDIPLCKNKDDITELFAKIHECILKLSECHTGG